MIMLTFKLLTAGARYCIVCLLAPPGSTNECAALNLSEGKRTLAAIPNPDGRINYLLKLLYTTK